jgi:hypothetical protein
MLKKISKTSLSLAILLTTAMAGGAAHAAEQGFFAEAGVGFTSMDTGLDGMPGVSVDEEDVFFSIGGGYNFTNMFAAEAGYIDLGEASISFSDVFFGNYKATVSVDGIYFGPRLTFGVTEQLDAYARIGLLAWDAEFKDSDGFSASDDGTDVYFGLGAAWNISQQFAVGADWTRYATESGGEDVDIDAFGAKVKYSF